MDSNSFASAVVAFIATYAVVAVIICVFLIVAYWKIFNKAGEAGWKSLIPIYNGYILYKISWNTTMFWVRIALSVVAGLLTYYGTSQDSQACTIIANIVSLATTVIYVMQFYKLSKSFGHGVGFTLGLLFLPNIFTLMLGFGKSEYIGPEGIPADKTENV